MFFGYRVWWMWGMRWLWRLRCLIIGSRLYEPELCLSLYIRTRNDETAHQLNLHFKIPTDKALQGDSIDSYDRTATHIRATDLFELWAQFWNLGNCITHLHALSYLPHEYLLFFLIFVLYFNFRPEHVHCDLATLRCSPILFVLLSFANK